MGGGSRGRGGEISGLAVTYFPGDFGGDLKWNEFVKSLKAIDQPHYFYRIFLLLLFISLPIPMSFPVPISLSLI